MQKITFLFVLLFKNSSGQKVFSKLLHYLINNLEVNVNELKDENLRRKRICF